MPEAFDRCRRDGGKIRTVTGPSERWGLKKGEYVHVCFKDGEAHRGHTKKKDESSKD